MLNLIRKLPLIFLLSLLPAVQGAPYVFVFHGDTVTASVYDSETLELVGTPSVGQRASLAFGITNKQAGGAFEKFYVVTHNSVVVLNSDFSPRGTIFLEGTGRCEAIRFWAGISLGFFGGPPFFWVDGVFELGSI